MASLSRTVLRTTTRSLQRRAIISSTSTAPRLIAATSPKSYSQRPAAAFSTMTILKSDAPNPSGPKVYDPEIVDMATYIHNYELNSDLAVTRHCSSRLLDTLGCGLRALEFPQCANLLGPVVPGTTVPNGTKVPGTSYQLDPINGAFNIGAMIRWLDFNDCWLAAEWGHPSDNLGAILAVADWVTRTNKNGGNIAGGKQFTIKDVLEGMIKAHEIQGVLALENSFTRSVSTTSSWSRWHRPRWCRR
ncbi:hypothetical protein MRB53_039055 [Persea americana]|nr:hypothetical protein MRB53_039055 [Persea americana]